jgi:hypothetical protein
VCDVYDNVHSFLRFTVISTEMFRDTIVKIHISFFTPLCMFVHCQQLNPSVSNTLNKIKQKRLT